MINLSPTYDLNKRQDEADLVAKLTAQADLSPPSRRQIAIETTMLVTRVRAESTPGLMGAFLAEYGLSTQEGVALMCLAEALLRTPDALTLDALIEDKIAPSDWSRHLGHSSSSLVNASTWGLFLSGKILDDVESGIVGTLRGAIQRLGEPLIRAGALRAMKVMGQQFVLGETITAAMKQARAKERQGFTFSYDMLGEAAVTAADAARYVEAYSTAIATLAKSCTADQVRANPGISIKLSALHPRYEVAKYEQVMRDLVPVVTKLARQAAAANMGVNIDAEEADRLALSMAVIDRVMADPALPPWHGLGVVVQAYGRRAGDVIHGLYALAKQHRRRLMVRLVKGAYWDTEIKHAQTQGLTDFPVFTRKAATDISYLAQARTLLEMSDWLYPQFATHNAHTLSAILHMARDWDQFEFQRLHGMGEALHDLVKARDKTACRIYAPVGAHRDLLAYLVRRLLENGANSSFVHRLIDASVPASRVAPCPFETLAAEQSAQPLAFAKGPQIYAPARQNSKGFDLSDSTNLRRIHDQLPPPDPIKVQAIMATPPQGTRRQDLLNPADGTRLGHVTFANPNDVANAFAAAKPWSATPETRARILNQAADFYEADFGRAFALLAREAGKTLPDAVAELREAVDFLRYYAAEAAHLTAPARGIFTCISPWNFPLAIFTGQVAAALAAGNAALAKPAEATPAIADWAVRHLLRAGVPATALQFLPGEGGTVGRALTADPRVAGVAFTGSTHTAKTIQRTLAQHGASGTPLIAETGGLNAMIVDSTALPEQAVRDILTSAFQSAGQRCSALRCLYVQADIAANFLTMLKGAMDELTLGDPQDLATDIGPVISAQARDQIETYVAAARQEGRLLHRLDRPACGTFVGPSLIAVQSIGDLKQEIFGPVLHWATFEAQELDQVVAAINATGYGLTFGVHSRIERRVQTLSDQIRAGNIYVNRNQIGAIVGSQPFGGEGLSGTGPKAGGPLYLPRFTVTKAPKVTGDFANPADLAAQDTPPDTPSRPVSITHLPGPTGELNQLTTLPRPPLLCLGPSQEAVQQQKAAVERFGGVAIAAQGTLPAADLSLAPALAGVIWWGDATRARAYAQALAQRAGPIVPLITDVPDRAHVLQERHLCVDTTAAGGNTALLAGSESSKPGQISQKVNLG